MQHIPETQQRWLSMLVLPSITALRSAGSLLVLNGALGYAWLALWLAVGRDIPHR